MLPLTRMGRKALLGAFALLAVAGCQRETAAPTAVPVATKTPVVAAPVLSEAAKSDLAAKQISGKVDALPETGHGAGDDAPIEAKAEWAQKYVRDLQAKLDTEQSLAAVRTQEKLVAAIERDVFAGWKQSWQAGKAGLAAVSTPDAAWSAWGGAKLQGARDRDGIQEAKLSGAAVAVAADEAQLLKDVKQVVDFRLEVLGVARGDKGDVTLTTRFDMRSVLTDGARRQDRGELALTFQSVEGVWKLSAGKAVQAERLTAQATRVPAFEVATAQTKLDEKAQIIDRREAIRRGGYAMAVADYSGDGKPDVLLGHYGKVQLLQATATGYEDVTAKAGVEPETLVKAATIADLDGDGARDLVLLRFVMFSADARGDIVFYRNKGDGTFERKTDVLPKSRDYDRAMPLTLADFDKDGALDMYIGFPGARDFTNGLGSATRPNDLASQGIWLNKGKWTFEEAAVDNTMVKANSVYPHSALATDLNQDGNIDVVVVDDSGRINPFYAGDGKGGFREQSAKAGLASPGWSMGTTTGDFDNDGDLDVMSTHVSLYVAQRMMQVAGQSSGKVKEMLDMLKMSYVGAQLFRNIGGGKFEEVTAKAGLTDVGDGAGAAEWLDFNGDGHLDLYVPNGLWSAKGNTNFDSDFLQAMLVAPEQGYGMRQNDVVGGSTLNKSDPNPMLTALRNFKTADGDRLSLGGHQRHRLFRNNADGTFTEVGFFEDADRTEDGYVVAMADMDGDGVQDMFLRNTDPSPSMRYSSVTVLRNRRAGQNTLTVALQAKGANRDAIGATVSAIVDGRPAVREIRATTGATQGEPVAYFGLGTAKSVTGVEVRWPSGKTEAFGTKAAGRQTLVEGQGDKPTAAMK
jgi:hypothetical protein